MPGVKRSLALTLCIRWLPVSVNGGFCRGFGGSGWGLNPPRIGNLPLPRAARRAKFVASGFFCYSFPYSRAHVKRFAIIAISDECKPASRNGRGIRLRSVSSRAHRTQSLYLEDHRATHPFLQLAGAPKADHDIKRVQRHEGDTEKIRPPAPFGKDR